MAAIDQDILNRITKAQFEIQAQRETKEQSETKGHKDRGFSIPKNWTLIKGNLDEVLKPGSKEEVYFRILSDDREVKGLSEKIKLQTVFITRDNGNSKDSGESSKSSDHIVVYFINQTSKKENGLYVLQKSASGVEIPMFCGNSSELVKCLTLASYRAMLPSFVESRMLITQNAPKDGSLSGLWSSFNIGQLPSYYAEKAWKFLHTTGLLTEEEANCLEAICGYKPLSPEEQIWENKLKECLKAKELDIKFALECAKNLHQLSIKINKQNKTSLGLPSEDGIAQGNGPKFDPDGGMRSGGSHTVYLDESRAAWDLGFHFINLGQYDAAIEAFKIIDDFTVEHTTSPLEDEAEEMIIQCVRLQYKDDEENIVSKLKTFGEKAGFAAAAKFFEIKYGTKPDNEEEMLEKVKKYFPEVDFEKLKSESESDSEDEEEDLADKKPSGKNKP